LDIVLMLCFWARSKLCNIE